MQMGHGEFKSVSVYPIFIVFLHLFLSITNILARFVKCIAFLITFCLKRESIPIKTFTLLLFEIKILQVLKRLFSCDLCAILWL